MRRRHREGLAAALLIAAMGASPSLAAGPGFHHALPAESQLRIVRDVAYFDDAGTPRAMDVYRPRATRDRDHLPVMVFVNTQAGSSFRDWDLYTGWARLAASRGFVAILPDGASDFGAGFAGLLAYLDTHAAELGADAGRVAAYAASGNASAGLSALSNPDFTALHALVVYYGGGEVERFRPDLPILFVRAGLDRPGTNAALDRTFDRARRQNAPVRMIAYPAGHHGFEALDDNATTRAIIDETLEFVRGALDPAAIASLEAGMPDARAAAAYGEGDFETASRLYGELVEKRPDDAPLRLSYGEALLAAGRYAEAQRTFESLRGAGLGYRDLGLPAARAALNAGDPEGAVGWLRTIPRRFLPANLADDPNFAGLRDRPDFRALFQ